MSAADSPTGGEELPLARRIWRRFGRAPGVISMALVEDVARRTGRFGAPGLAAEILGRWTPASGAPWQTALLHRRPAAFDHPPWQGGGQEGGGPPRSAAAPLAAPAMSPEPPRPAGKRPAPCRGVREMERPLLRRKVGGSPTQGAGAAPPGRAMEDERAAPASGATVVESGTSRAATLPAFPVLRPSPSSPILRRSTAAGAAAPNGPPIAAPGLDTAGSSPLPATARPLAVLRAQGAGTATPARVVNGERTAPPSATTVVENAAPRDATTVPTSPVVRPSSSSPILRRSRAAGTAEPPGPPTAPPGGDYAVSPSLPAAALPPAVLRGRPASPRTAPASAEESLPAIAAAIPRSGAALPLRRRSLGAGLAELPGLPAAAAPPAALPYTPRAGGAAALAPTPLAERRPAAIPSVRAAPVPPPPGVLAAASAALPLAPAPRPASPVTGGTLQRSSVTAPAPAAPGAAATAAGSPPPAAAAAASPQTAAPPAADRDELVEQVLHRLARSLAVDAERRGRRPWP